MLRYLSSGETHGKGILALLDGFPAGMEIDVAQIDAELKRRQGGYGRGGRQLIESDTVEFLGGTWCHDGKEKTTGAPISLWVKNRDHKINEMPELEVPRPGHADLSGALKYEQPIRPVLERASARETAARVAAGALARQLLELFSVRILGYVVGIGPISLDTIPCDSFEKMLERRNRSVFYSLTPEKDEEAKQFVDTMKEQGDSVGGLIEVQVHNVPSGLGTHTQWDRKLDGRLAQAVMSIQAIKGVEIGSGFDSARQPGSQVHDPIRFESEKGFFRTTNNAGGIEGGMSNGETIVLRAAMKPIPTMRTPLDSVHFRTKNPQAAQYERSDVCAVPAASVVVENAVALEIAAAFLERFGADSVEQIRRHFGKNER